MRAASIVAYREPLVLGEVPDPEPSPTGVVLQVAATGICHSDYHGWTGDAPYPSLPHVPGHEMVGTVVAVGSDVTKWAVGDRVTVPFSVGCGECGPCRQGWTNICDVNFTPGFTAWGSFAEYVAIEYADRNLVALPEDLSSVHGAALGCRFVTAYRALKARGGVGDEMRLAVFGCGGVGLSAVMIGAALGAEVIAVDLDDARLARATEFGASRVLNAGDGPVWEQIRDLTGSGADVTIDAVGAPAVVRDAVMSLRKRGRHVQVGLLVGENADPRLPMEQVIMRELEIVGSRGLPAANYSDVFELIASEKVDPARLVDRTVDLEEGARLVTQMDRYTGVGVTVIDRF
ncbi:MAG TPA: zinc-dependent alcohol dehydrogenase family protein [Acidimicrobiia bacterium]